ncbi:MAG: lysophospholipid acyltransferase family protein [Bacteroidetes bacterium]|nr:lysophospholipid acyltransferase family protein [Bacteroidota bacterium]
MPVVNFLFRIYLYLLSLLPFWMLYLYSDFLAFLAYSIIRYRRHEVLDNLRKAFPEQTEKQRKRIARRFYRNLTDVILEMIKTPRLSEEQLAQRVKIKNLDLLNQFYSEKRSVIGIFAHLFSWEWVGYCANMSIRQRPYVVIKPMKNPFFNNYITGIRTHFTKDYLVHLRETMKVIIENKNDTCVYWIAADQSPPRQEVSFWTPFFGQDTPFSLGIEKVAKRFDMGVIYCHIRRSSRRGHYELEFQLVMDHTHDSADFAITEKVARLIEDNIRQDPTNWLWSHRRWKYRREDMEAKTYSA